MPRLPMLSLQLLLLQWWVPNRTLKVGSVMMMMMMGEAQGKARWVAFCSHSWWWS